MDTLSIVFNLLAYAAASIFIGGLLYRIVQYFNTPSPLKIPGTPAPKTSIGVVFRLLPEILFFRTLLRGGVAEKILWVGGWFFHVSLFFILFRHVRFVTYPVPGFVMAVQQIGLAAAHLFPFALLILIVRRFLNDRMAVISLFQDYFVLFLLLGIGLTGIILKYFLRTNLVDVKAFMLGLVTLSPAPVPHSPVFLIHVILAAILVIYFPFSKLLHAWGVLMSPTRAQTDNPREVRHVAPWAK
ncbi:MAG: respiratory nitrate reductase subunit gamma [Nitrospirae bacterium]|nr:respiratory nitrate reductase subunit gamma [Nitrospirota bacterium]